MPVLIRMAAGVPANIRCSHERSPPTHAELSHCEGKVAVGGVDSPRESTRKPHPRIVTQRAGEDLRG
jgi:hypothetical protein